MLTTVNTRPPALCRLRHHQAKEEFVPITGEMAGGGAAGLGP
jgi:hypothetical protein